MYIFKDPLPKGYSFMLSSSLLTTAWEAAGIQVDTSLHHCNSHSCLRAWLMLPNPIVPHDRISLSAGVMPRAKAREARAFVQAEALPQLVAWATSLLALPTNSTHRDKRLFEIDLANL